ncbi:MAG: hypothetical protein L0Y70_28850 [Gemmataceae bacterium]|nr:hypothetical protein [Gemmataceae bacterium]
MCRHLWTVVVAGSLVTLGGCSSTGERKPIFQWGQNQPRAPLNMPPAPAPFVQGNIQPGGAFPTAPGNTFPTAPPNGGQHLPTLPPGAAPTPFPTAPPGQVSPSGGFSTAIPPEIKTESKWQPADSGVQLQKPEPVTEQSKPEARISLSPSTLPVGIAQFAGALDSVAVGLRPTPDEGFEWLAARGYRTVLYLHQPGEDAQTDKKHVEKRGMKFLSLEVSPPTLGKMTVEEFNRVIRDKAGQPLFVYDRDGASSGALWYLYFRIVEQESEEVARIRASALGLRETREGLHRDMWQAAQKFFQEIDR